MQSQAKAALLFLYQKVLEQDVEWLQDVVSAKQSQHMPIVLTVDEVRTLLGHLEGTSWLIASLLYGSGLRILEACRLRVLDLDFNMRQPTVRHDSYPRFEPWRTRCDNPFGSLGRQSWGPKQSGYNSKNKPD